MLALSSDIARPGRLFRELIQHRKQTGSFSGDVDEYCRTVKSACEIGRVSHSTAMIPDGRWMQVVNQPLAEGGWVATIEDVTEQRRSEERTVRLALYDTLTELPNRTLFLRKLEEEILQCDEDSQFAVLFLDTDEFKSVNDSQRRLIMARDKRFTSARSATGHMDSRTFCDRRAVDGSNNRTPQRRLQLLSSSLRLSGVGSGGRSVSCGRTRSRCTWSYWLAIQNGVASRDLPRSADFVYATAAITRGLTSYALSTVPLASTSTRETS